MTAILAYIIVSVIFSAIFSGIEIAFVSSNKFHIEVENKKGNFSYQIISRLIKHPSRFIASMLVGNNIALVIYGLFMPYLLNPIFDFEFITGNSYLLLLFQTVVSTVFILIFAEFLPKAVFNSNSTFFLKLFAVPSAFFYYLFYPVVSLMIVLSNFVLKYILRTDTRQAEFVFDKLDLDNYVRERTEAATPNEEEVDTEVQIFRNALEFNEIKAREFMIPRTEVVAMEVDMGLETLTKSFIDSSLSKILIYKESIDNIIGYTHSFELFKKPSDITSILRPVSFIPESMPANEVLNLLIKERRSIAVVVDEFGGTSGLVTMEDIVEELFGEIDDEHDTEDHLEEKISETEFRFSARQEIDYLNNKYDLKLPESENYNTLGGLIINFLESIPEKGEKIRLSPYIFRIEEVTDSKIEVVFLRISED